MINYTNSMIIIAYTPLCCICFCATKAKICAAEATALPETVVGTGASETVEETQVDGYMEVSTEPSSKETLPPVDPFEETLPVDPFQETLPPVDDIVDETPESPSKKALAVDAPENSPTQETQKTDPQIDEFVRELNKIVVETPVEKDTALAESKEPWDQYAQACAATDRARLSGEPQVVATPCRNTANLKQPSAAVTPAISEGSHVATPPPKHAAPSPSDVTEPPDVRDLLAERPVPGELQLSDNAINLRIHRAMKIDSKGNSRVSDEIRKQFHTKKGKLRLMQVFQSCGFDTDRGLTKRVVFERCNGFFQLHL